MLANSMLAMKLRAALAAQGRRTQAAAQLQAQPPSAVQAQPPSAVQAQLPPSPPAAHAPTLEAVGEDSIRVTWAVPRGVAKPQAHAEISLRVEGSSRWLRVDAVSGKLDEPDALPLPLETTCCVVKSIDPQVTYVARVRLGNQSGWGPDSPSSKGLQLAALTPIAPAAPILEAVDSTSLRVHFTLPPVRPGTPASPSSPISAIAIFVQPDGGAWQLLDATSSTLTAGTGNAFLPAASRALAKGLSEGVTYKAKIRAKSVCGWGEFSPISEPLQLHFKPTAPAAPVLEEALDATSMRVHYTLPPVRPGTPAHKWLAIHVQPDGGAWQVLDALSSTLSDTPRKVVQLLSGSPSYAVVKGLSEGVTYRARVHTENIHGWSAFSPISEPLQLPVSEVEVTGSRSREERDAELRKRAVDVDAEVVDLDASPCPKRAR